MEHSVSIDQGKYRQEGQCDFDDLRRASEALLQGSESELQSLKNEPWYRRVFDLVTFSDRKGVQVASHIQTLAQAQGIFAEILARLSSIDVNTMELLSSVNADIQHLVANDLKLSRRIFAIEYASCNFVGQQEIDNFSVTEKKTLAGLIRSVSETIIPNDLQKRYASRLFSALQVQEANLADPVILLSNVDSTNHKRHMLFCCLEYLFLENEALDLERVDQHFVGSFDFSARIWNELKSRIDSKYKLLGIDGFVGNLPLESDIADEFEVMLEFDAVEEACEPAPRTEHEILNMLIIVEGEKIVFENADIFLGSFINCTGTLVLRNCSIDYGKSMTQGRILLEEGATLEVDGSEILGFPSEDPEHSFITCKGKNKITIRNSKLIDCSHFIENESSAIEIADSKLVNPGGGFLKGGYEVCSFRLLHCTILFKDFSEAKEAEFDSYGTVFSCAYEAIFEDLVFIADKVLDCTRMDIISARDGVMKNCQFRGIRRVIRYLKVIDNCVFDGCGDVIHPAVFSGGGKATTVSNSVFQRCRSVFEGEGILVRSSRFYDCVGCIVEGYNIEFELCEFIGQSSFRLFRCDSGRQGLSFKYCVFDGFEATENWKLFGVIHAESHMKDKIRVEECSFQNCRTSSTDGALFIASENIKGFFSDSTIRLVDVYKCTGLDKISKEGGEYIN